jgi:hypothetical protein
MIGFTEYLTEQKDMGYSRTPKSGNGYRQLS